MPFTSSSLLLAPGPSRIPSLELFLELILSYYYFHYEKRYSRKVFLLGSVSIQLHQVIANRVTQLCVSYMI